MRIFICLRCAKDLLMINKFSSPERVARCCGRGVAVAALSTAALPTAALPAAICKFLHVSLINLARVDCVDSLSMMT